MKAREEMAMKKWGCMLKIGLIWACMAFCVCFSACGSEDPEIIVFATPAASESGEADREAETSSKERTTAARTTAAPTTKPASIEDDYTETESHDPEEAPPVTNETSSEALPETEPSTTEAVTTTEVITTPAPTTQAPTTAAPATEAAPSSTYPFWTEDPSALKAAKAVYLTFDDGPSVNTPYVLDQLDQYGVKATFFVTYQPDFENLYREIVNRGHAIAVHTASHKYDVIYASFDNWLQDFRKIYDYIVSVTGVTPKLYRFPGGSNTKNATAEVLKQIKDYLHSIGMEYVDWNVSAEDAVGIDTLQNVYDNVFPAVEHRTVPVVLMHDGERQNKTVYSLPEVLSRIKNKGFEFRRLTLAVPPVQMGTNWDY